MFIINELTADPLPYFSPWFSSSVYLSAFINVY